MLRTVESWLRGFHFFEDSVASGDGMSPELTSLRAHPFFLHTGYAHLRPDTAYEHLQLFDLRRWDLAPESSTCWWKHSGQ